MVEENPNQPSSDQYLDTTAAAALLGFSPRALEAWRVRGGGPAYLKMGGRRSVRYKLSELMAWAESDRRTSTSDPGGESCG